MLGVVSLIAGCGQTIRGCEDWEPIRPMKSDMATMSSNLEVQILAHNVHGERNCGWKP